MALLRVTQYVSQDVQTSKTLDQGPLKGQSFFEPTKLSLLQCSFLGSLFFCSQLVQQHRACIDIDDAIQRLPRSEHHRTADRYIIPQHPKNEATCHPRSSGGDALPTK
eukprot:gb/GECG01011519.1/.p1 GENE.gb/GECG01011519.1/~~gb/GECG01011519.1/.p1  ORF type:complete len:108 (+),score=8.76 gb/GECG01011519.1/:1-324(+)